MIPFDRLQVENSSGTEAKLIEDKVVIKALSDHRDLLLAEVRLLNFAQQSCLEAGAKSNDEAIQLRRELVQYEIDIIQLRGELAESKSASGLLLEELRAQFISSKV